ncbi:MAG: 3-oxoacyl-ACP synthase [Flavobacteriales bacterium]
MSMDRSAVVAALEAALMTAMDEARAAMDELSSSLGKETKSTAGDKHETGRAMVQREMEQAGDRLARCEAMQTVASRLELDRPRTVVGPGAIVVSGDARLLIGVGLGPFEVPDVGRVQAISANAPIAVALAGGQAGERREFRGRPWVIESVD